MSSRNIVNLSKYQSSRSHGIAILMIAILMIAIAGCRPSSQPSVTVSTTDSKPQLPPDDATSTPPLPVLFQDVTRQFGLDFLNRPAEDVPQYFLPNSIGSGCAVFDYDGDGLLDLYLIQNAGPNAPWTNQLYRQTPTGFTDVTANSGLGVAGHGMGVACGDVNNDGRVDVLLNEYGQCRLLMNQSEGVTPRFVDMTQSSGLSNSMWGTSTCMFDFDRDGWLDLVLVNYLNYDPSRWCADGSSRQEFCGPDAFPGRVAKLFRNRTSDGEVRFEDVTIASGLADTPGPGLGVFCADFDGDRWPDIFVANDGKPNHLWINQRDGTFREEATTRGLGYNSMGRTEANMGVAIGDVDQDGMFDLFVTHLADETHTLWRQGPRGIFVDRTATSGVTATKWRGTGFGTVMCDLDNDGDLDLLVANGRVRREPGPLPPMAKGLDPFWHPYAQRDQVMLNQGNRFVDVSLQNDALCGLAHVSRGMAVADFNNDGRNDLVVTHTAGPPSLLINQYENENHWLAVRAVDPRWQRDAYGAEVYVEAGGHVWMRWINPGYSFLCSNDPRAHFGLGTVSRIDAIRIIWPDGMEERFPGGLIDCEVVLRRGHGNTTASPGAAKRLSPREKTTIQG